METKRADRHHELGNFLRSRREKTTPEQFGISPGQRRRTPGLRRGEVASLAGVSLEWYTYLEQGRPIQVSYEVLDSLARVFQLDENERRHLFVLADRRHLQHHIQLEESIPPALLHFLNGLDLTPAYVIDKRMNLLAWNKAFEAIYVKYLENDGAPLNLVWITFTSASFRELKGEHWEEEARHCIAQFRSGYGRYLEDPWWTEQIDNLKDCSEEFNLMWEQQQILYAPLGKKIIYHPAVGKMVFDYIAFQETQNSDLQVIINNPVTGTGTKRGIRTLLEMNQSV